MRMITPDEAHAMPVGDLAEQSAPALHQLKLDAAHALAAAKGFAEHVERALELKYGIVAHRARLAAGKDAGVVHFDDGVVRITADLPKRVEWDQKQLADIVTRIRTSGEDPSEFIEVAYRVSETKYNAWPESLRATFSAARTLKTGKPGFRLALVGEGA